MHSDLPSSAQRHLVHSHVTTFPLSRQQSHLDNAAPKNTLDQYPTSTPNADAKHCDPSLGSGDTLHLAPAGLLLTGNIHLGLGRWEFPGRDSPLKELVELLECATLDLRSEEEIEEPDNSSSSSVNEC
jgi:hypothetical protein